MRIVIFIMIAACALEGIWWLLVPLTLLYLYRYAGYELVIIAFLIDGYVGAFYTLPLYSLVAITFVSLANWARPKILLYTE